jgi:hypothetical protein
VPGDAGGLGEHRGATESSRTRYDEMRRWSMYEDDITVEDAVKITEKLKDYFDSITR